MIVHPDHHFQVNTYNDIEFHPLAEIKNKQLRIIHNFFKYVFLIMASLLDKIHSSHSEVERSLLTKSSCCFASTCLRNKSNFRSLMPSAINPSTVFIRYSAQEPNFPDAVAILSTVVVNVI